MEGELSRKRGVSSFSSSRELLSPDNGGAGGGGVPQRGEVVGKTIKYLPFSILNALAKQEIRDYWFATGPPSYLIRLLQHSREYINELVGKYYDLSYFADYVVDAEHQLPILYQNGYLTIKGCYKRTGAFMLDFPNDEVRKGFL